MVHQMSHVLEQQRMSMDQYLMLVKKSQKEYEESLRPDAERRVKQQLVLDEIGKQEEIKVTLDEVQQLFNLYAQVGQSLPQTEEQVRSVASSMQREKTIARLLELTTDPDPDEVKEEVAEETSEAAEEQEEAVDQAVAGVESAIEIEEGEKAVE